MLSLRRDEFPLLDFHTVVAVKFEHLEKGICNTESVTILSLGVDTTARRADMKTHFNAHNIVVVRKLAGGGGHSEMILRR